MNTPITTANRWYIGPANFGESTESELDPNGEWVPFTVAESLETRLSRVETALQNLINTGSKVSDVMNGYWFSPTGDGDEMNNDDVIDGQRDLNAALDEARAALALEETK